MVLSLLVSVFLFSLGVLLESQYQQAHIIGARLRGIRRSLLLTSGRKGSGKIPIVEKYNNKRPGSQQEAKPIALKRNRSQDGFSRNFLDPCAVKLNVIPYDEISRAATAHICLSKSSMD